MKNIISLFRSFKNFNTYGFPLLILYIIMITFFSFTTDHYFSMTNFKVMASGFSIVGIVAAGVFMPMLAGTFDLSIGGTISLVCVLIVYMFDIGLSVPLVILLSLVIGALVGLVNGFICSKIKLNSVITTLGTASILGGLAKLISVSIKKENIYSPSFQKISSIFIMNKIPVLFIYMLVIYIVLSLILKYTKLGRNIYAVGGNYEIARIVGINSDKIQFITFIISGIFSSMGAILLTSKLTIGRPEFGLHYPLDAIAICVLGGLILGRGKGDLFGVFMAVIVLGSVSNGLIMLGITSYVRYIVTGSILIIAIVINEFRFQREFSK